MASSMVMASRLSVVNALAKQGYLPNHKKYSFHVKTHLINEFKIEQESVKESSEKKFDYEVSQFASKVKGFYVNTKIGNYDVEYLKKRKANWLSIDIKIPIETEVPKDPLPEKEKKRKRKKKPGPKKKDFKDSCRTGKFTKATNIKGNNSLESLIHAALLKAQSEGNPDITWILRELVSSPAEEGSRFRKAMEHYNKEKVTAYTPEEALALIIELRLSKNSYKRLRKKAKKKYANLYPAYDPAVTDYMKKCKPPNIDLTKSDEVKLPMQSALDHQLLNILELPSVVNRHADLIKQCEQSGLDYELKLFFKYGADGTSDQCQYQNVSAGL